MFDTFRQFCAAPIFRALLGGSQCLDLGRQATMIDAPIVPQDSDLWLYGQAMSCTIHHQKHYRWARHIQLMCNCCHLIPNVHNHFWVSDMFPSMRRMECWTAQNPACGDIGIWGLWWFERGGKDPPTPKISALLRKWPGLLRANFVLVKDRKRPYYGHFCGKMHREGSCSKAAGGP